MRRLERLLAIALFLGARRRVRASDVAARFGVSLRTVYRDMRALAMLEAIRECHAASIRYFDPRSGAQTRRAVEPVGLVCRGDAGWLVAWCRLRGDARAFRVDGISEWKDAGVFTPREGFSLDEIIRRDRHLGPALFGS